jgi:hypothetical protein
LLFGIALPRLSLLILLRGAIAVAVFVLAYNGGSFGLVARHELAIAVWWAILLLVALRLFPLAIGPAALLGALLLASLTLMTLLSIAWSSSAEASFAEFDRTALYLGVFVLALLAGGRLSAPAWADGIALGLSAIAVAALLSRFFPHTFAHGSLPTYLPGAGARLTFPVDYWNGLGILVALALPLLLRAATAEPALAAGAALVPVPAIAATIYLTSSRGGVAAAILGVVVFVALTADRWRALAAVVVAAAGSAAAVAVLVTRHTLVDGPLASQAAVDQGKTAAVLVAIVCVVTGAVFVVASRWSVRPPRAAGWVTFAVVVVVAAAAMVAAHPVKRFDEFKQPPAASAGPNFVQAHLLSGRGNGRWQFWRSALNEFRHYPLVGHGAGSYESWWAQHGSIAYFVRDAHSLYFETLGELGIVGFLLLVGGFAAAVAAGVRGMLAEGERRVTAAALVAGFGGYAIGAALDWMWELTIVSVVGLACLGLAASLEEGWPRLRAWGRAPRLAVGVATAAGALALVAAEAIPLGSELGLRDSQAAAARGDAAAALTNAKRARDLEPWASTPNLQEALVEEASGQLAAARAAIGHAIARSGEDWRLPFVAARIETEAGDVRAAVASYERARELNPRSPIFAAGAR